MTVPSNSPQNGHRQARFISPDNDTVGAPLLRVRFVLDREPADVTSATLDFSARGVVEAWINGKRASDDVLTPGWSSYEWRTRFARRDVTALVDAAEGALGLALGNGWYRGKLGPDGDSAFYGSELAGFAELRILFADGHEQIVTTDESWKSHESDVTFNDIYDGQHIDARLRIPSWATSQFDDSGWSGVHAAAPQSELLEPYIGPPIRRRETLVPARIWLSPSGRILADFGQNLVGWMRVRAIGPAGSTITVRHAEVLEQGELATRPLRKARATDQFILSGRSDEFEPSLTFHGFRYVEIDGWPGGIDALSPDSLSAIVVHSDLPRIGHFETSDPLLNQLHRNVVWGARGNFVGLPTDCPQRDERLGWTGDIAVFAPTAAFLFDSKDFLRDWLRDLRLEQLAHHGAVPSVVPDVLKYIRGENGPAEPTAIWSDAAVWVPWALWVAYGDQVVLVDSLDSMLEHGRLVASMLSESGVWDTGIQYGDWLDPDSPPNEPGAAKADAGVVATAAFYRSAIFIAEACGILGRHAEQREFLAVASDVRRAFHAEYVLNERIHSDATTAYVLAIVFGLLDDTECDWAGRRLAELVVESGHLISTGFAGTPFILDALSSTGHLDTAYSLLLQQRPPSWLYPVTMGATTIWERWDSMLPNGSINPGEMTSFNHYALGAVADWMHRSIGGIAPLKSGYRRTLIAPQPGKHLRWASTSLKSPRGVISVRWTRVSDQISVDFVVPPATTAVLRIDGCIDEEFGEGSHSVVRPYHVET